LKRKFPLNKLDCSILTIYKISKYFIYCEKGKMKKRRDPKVENFKKKIVKVDFNFILKSS